MESPFKSWCYNCNAYHNPNIQYRLVPAMHEISLEYRAICPLCHKKMIPDKKIRAVLNLVKEQINKDIKK